MGVAQTVEGDPSNASRLDQAVERLGQTVRVPRYSIVAKEKLASADPWVR